MLGDLPESPTIAAVVAESRALCHELGLPADLDSPAALRDTVATQLSLLIAGTACAKGLIDDFGLVPQFVAGHSVGAFAAAAVANVLTLREALIAVHLRGESMRAACAGRDWAMAAVTGLPTRTAQQLAERTSTAEAPVWVANINTATQTVLGGTATALAAAHEAARLAGATAFDRLDVAVASHGRSRTQPPARCMPTSRRCRSAMPRCATSPTCAAEALALLRPSSTTWRTRWRTRCAGTTVSG